jgi:hypothetical protein
MSERDARQLSGLPTTLEKAEAARLEAEAVAYARELIRMAKDGRIKFGAPLAGITPTVSPFDKAGGRVAGIEVLKDEALSNPKTIIALLDLAREGFPLAIRVLCDLIVVFEHRSLPKPPALALFTQLLAAGKIRLLSRGPERGNGVWRDVVFTFIIGSVCQRFGMRPTRLQILSKRKRLSGCLIVFLASREEKPATSEPSLVEAWRRYGKAATALMQPSWTFASD